MPVFASNQFGFNDMASVAAFVVFMTVLLRLCVQPSNGNIDAEKIAKCMKESNIAEFSTFKKILDDQNRKYPQENCIRKCLYEEMYLVNEMGEINIATVKDILTKYKTPVTAQMVTDCSEQMAKHRNNPCDLGANWVHCFMPKLQFQYPQ